MTDSDRLDAIEQYGLCVVQHQILEGGHWYTAWACQFSGPQGPGLITGATIRDVIDGAVGVLQAVTVSRTTH